MGLSGPLSQHSSSFANPTASLSDLWRYLEHIAHPLCYQHRLILLYDQRIRPLHGHQLDYAYPILLLLCHRIPSKVCEVTACRQSKLRLHRLGGLECVKPTVSLRRRIHILNYQTFQQQSLGHPQKTLMTKSIDRLARQRVARREGRTPN